MRLVVNICVVFLCVGLGKLGIIKCKFFLGFFNENLMYKRKGRNFIKKIIMYNIICMMR